MSPLQRAFDLHRNGPRSCAIDRFTVHLKPAANVEQQFLLVLRDSAVWAWPYIEEQCAIFTHDVDQVFNEGIGCFVLLVLQNPRRQFGDGGICLPVQRSNTGELSAFDIKDCRSLWESFELVVNGDAAFPFRCTIIVIGCKFLSIGFEYRLLNPPVKPE